MHSTAVDVDPQDLCPNYIDQRIALQAAKGQAKKRMAEELAGIGSQF
jgi:hypothetical protein